MSMGGPPGPYVTQKTPALQLKAAIACLRHLSFSRPTLNTKSQELRAYDGHARGELEYAMSASGSPPPLHRIGIVMSPVGRFLQCRDCQLTYTFPDGAKFGTIAKQFESHLCLSPILSKGWQIDRRFVVVRYEGKVPAMASCSNCKHKFFTPTALARDAVGAEEYLGRKYDTHECEELKR
jgi:hypothetical protein